MVETLIATIRSLTENLGWCPKCMRTSFIAAASAAALAASLTYVSRDAWTIAVGWALAASLIGLWIAHLAAFALRTAKGIQANTARVALAGTSLSTVGVTSVGRRKFLSDLLKAFAFAALATALPDGFAEAAPCTVVSCSDTKCRCVAPTPRCVICPARRSVGCTTSDAVVCCTVQAFWTCQPRHDCYGNGTNADRCKPWR